MIYLIISLFSSNLEETPPRIVDKEFAVNDVFSFLFSKRRAATGASSSGLIFAFFNLSG